MKAILGLLLVILGTAAYGQHSTTNDSVSTKRSAAASDQRVIEILAQPQPAGRPQISLGKKLHAEGPVVDLMKNKRVFQAPRRFLHWINPLARRETSEPLERTGDLSPRAWTTTVGLNPGGSAFADAISHESKMSLVSVSR